MIPPLRIPAVVHLGPPLLALLVFPACRTEEVSPAQTPAIFSQTDPSQGELYIGIAPAATWDQYQASVGRAQYVLFVDGKELGVDDDSEAVVLGAWSGQSVGYFAPGVHHFAIASADATGTTIFACDDVITSGAQSRIYVYGPTNGLQARFESFALVPPAGSCHLSAINLLGSGGIQNQNRELHRRDDLHPRVAAARPRRHLRRRRSGDRRGFGHVGADLHHRCRLRVSTGRHALAPEPTCLPDDPGQLCAWGSGQFRGGAYLSAAAGRKYRRRLVRLSGRSRAKRALPANEERTSGLVDHFVVAREPEIVVRAVRKSCRLSLHFLKSLHVGAVLISAGGDLVLEQRFEADDGDGSIVQLKARRPRPPPRRR